eukprot:TRINITY_DN11516_c0_g1_i3.p1 TRINITY_DN11516_c0_g1~~TRINITY_DN11516_c0_g1_i3.p1  ORF type:complete len:1054 (+),score=248.22 TRINITY_DN11516_c0_g1_i3:165-3326(+)
MATTLHASECPGALCQIGSKGRLLDEGKDPLLRTAESGAQTDAWTAGSDFGGIDGTSSNNLSATTLRALVGERTNMPPDAAKRVLRLATGLLGLGVHEGSSNWAEVWLTFQDASIGSHAGLLPPGDSEDTIPPPQSVYKVEQRDWQQRILSKLREATEKSAAPSPRTARGSPRTAASAKEELEEPESHDWGPDFPEHLDLAEFMLRRISGAVSVLQDPEKEGRPLVLREYTEAMVQKVFADLRQWLEQLASVISLYHVHLLDLNAERRALARQLRTQRQSAVESADRLRAAELRCSDAHNRWKEKKLADRAEELLGLGQAESGPTTYSQEELDNILQRWKNEHLMPLESENKDLKLRIAELDEMLREFRMRRLSSFNEKAPPTNDAPPQPPPGLTLEDVPVLVKALDELSNRTLEDNVRFGLGKLATASSAGGGAPLAEALRDISKLPFPPPEEKRLSRPSSQSLLGLVPDARLGTAESRCSTAVQNTWATDGLSAVIAEIDNLVKILKTHPQRKQLEKFMMMMGWAQGSVVAVRSEIANMRMKHKGGTPLPKLMPAPAWDLAGFEKPTAKAFGCQVALPSPNDKGNAGAAAPVVEKKPASPAVDLEAQRRIKELLEELERVKAECEERLRREREKHAELIAKLEAELKAAEAREKSLKLKLVELKGIMQSKGLGQEAEDAFEQAGLNDYLLSGTVFERLYQDALDRIRRHAENQARHFANLQTEIIRKVQHVLEGFASVHVPSAPSPTSAALAAKSGYAPRGPPAAPAAAVAAPAAPALAPAPARGMTEATGMVLQGRMLDVRPRDASGPADAAAGGRGSAPTSPSTWLTRPRSADAQVAAPAGFAIKPVAGKDYAQPSYVNFVEAIDVSGAAISGPPGRESANSLLRRVAPLARAGQDSSCLGLSATEQFGGSAGNLPPLLAGRHLPSGADEACRHGSPHDAPARACGAPRMQQPRPPPPAGVSVRAMAAATAAAAATAGGHAADFALRIERLGPFGVNSGGGCEPGDKLGAFDGSSPPAKAGSGQRLHRHGGAVSMPQFRQQMLPQARLA